ncbi:MAG: trypsin-like serine peptidase, partial [Thermoanaerobaculia bacterium]
ATANGTTWGASFRVENAKRLRLHLQDVNLPAGTTLWVYGNTGEETAFDLSLRDENKSMWTPSIDGDTVHLEIEVPAGETGSFSVNELLELLTSRGAGLPVQSNDQPTCLAESAVGCISSGEFQAINAAKRAVGQMEFIRDGSGLVCSGTLITDQQQSNTPYFLTANHCIASQSSASSLETFFDYQFTTCQWADFSSLPKVVGSTLLVTSGTTDVTLLRLASVPANRALMGWTTAAASVGTVLHRISHPVPDGSPIGAFPQMYSRTIVTNASCSGIPKPQFVYSNESNGGEGGVYGGSSGSAIMLNDGKIVGQLRGSCGCPDPSAACDRRCATIDGSFAESFNLLKTHLSSTGSTPTPCTQNLTGGTVCLVGNRFSVRVTYDAGQGSQPMTAIKYTPDSGLFWFDNANNIEVLLKMVNACSFNQKFWVYSGGTTDVGVNITVTDSQSGAVKTYNNVRGTKFLTITDGAAFSCP